MAMADHGPIHSAQRVNEKPAGLAKKPSRGHFQPGLGMRGGDETHGMPMVPLNIDGQPLPPRRTNAKRWAFLVDAWALHHIAAIRISMRRHAPGFRFIAGEPMLCQWPARSMLSSATARPRLGRSMLA
jgi:hypothetical protein